MKCPICSHTTWKNLFPSIDRLYHFPGLFHTIRCNRCGLWSLDPFLKERAVRTYYPKTYYAYQKNTKPGIFWRLRSYMIKTSSSMKPIHRLLRFIIKVPALPSFVKHGKILDIGCGTGDTLVLFKHIGWDVYGLDIDRFAIQIARKRGLKKVTFGSYKTMSLYTDTNFDALRLYHVIEHLDNPDALLTLAHQKLKKGGELIIGTPNVRSFAAKVFKQYWYNLDCPRHLYIFSPKHLIVLLKKSGFTNINISFSSAGGILGSIQYFLHDKLRMNIDLINRPMLLFLLYPFERVLDTLGVGDVFVISANKSI